MRISDWSSDVCSSDLPPLVALWETESDRSDWPMGERAHALRRDAHAVWLAIRDPRTPWYAKLWGGLIAAYALSPIDLIPDFVPVLGLIDDLLILPAGIWVFVQLVPGELFAEHLRMAENASHRPVRRGGMAW